MIHDLLLTLFVLAVIGVVLSAAVQLAVAAIRYVETKMSDLDLFDWKPPAVKTSPTSVAAAKSVKSEAAILRDQVFDCLKENGPLTDEEMQLRLNMNGSTQRPRRVELWEAGLIEQSGMTRPTRSGRSAVVWRVKQEELIAAE